MGDIEPIRLSHGKEEVAYHEAGHAAIELIAGFVPQLVLIRDAGPEWEGDCYSRAPTDIAQSGWLARKAVAGALSQAKHAAEQWHRAGVILDPVACGADLVTFFLTPPHPDVNCRTVWRSRPAGRPITVDLVGGYSGPDFLHFRIAVAELSGVSFDPGSPGCREVAREAVTRCISTLDDGFVWQRVRWLADALLEAAPVTVQMVGRNEIETAAGML